MKKARYNTLFVVLLMLTGCVSSFTFSPYEKRIDTPAYSERDYSSPKAEQEELVIWTHDNFLDGSIENFQQYYPDVHFEVKIIDQVNVVEKYHESMIDGQTPDLFIIPDELLGSFSGIDGLEDLSNPLYYDQQFFGKRPSGLLENYYNAFGEMYAFPVLFFPYVTYYRSDILEQHGFPDDPEQLKDYLADLEQFIAMADILNENNHYVVDSPNMLIQTALRSSNFFTAEHEYLGQKGGFSDMIQAAIVLSERELAPLDLSIWTGEGLTALKEDQIVMFQMGSYGQDRLKDWVPEQSGKWRITSLPFDLAGIDATASSSVAIASTSENKQLAWTFVRHFANNMLEMHTDLEDDPFYDQENLAEFHWTIMEEEKLGIPSMLDHEVRIVWTEALYEFSNGEPVGQSRVNKVHRNVKSRIRYDQRGLQQGQ
ncbi:multiple sugar transport system substrate-binding protein [Natronobacillus azotifigens]|uniref:ABC transporter substrate-binding protein n=1 Tax=Natronobacillus azotifigens TaxID=472978 RepID=A0A9J6REJ2_9BACI|nr:ABC transporter substrate-binding protein [Natronobacillus azotifigens]MCZ0703763.1 ABC transporter substrate-binding protein [Natronobacillus azotifigens]